jgi:bacteriorhodopsin
MFEKITGRSFVLIHGSVGFLCFAYLLALNVMSFADNRAVLHGRQLVSEQEREVIEQEQMKSASRISVMFSSAFFFLMSVWLMSHQTEMNFGIVQRSILGKRLDFCMTLSLYISFFSALFNAIQLMDDDNLVIETLKGEDLVLDLGRPVEWMLTCPLMQLAVPILAGEKIPDSRRVSMPLLAFTVLSFGLLSTIASNIALKALMYSGGVLFFMAMLWQMNACIMEASNGGESLLSGSSFLRGLVVIIASTWIPFPIWYALSPEGFDIIQDAAGMKVAVAFLNVFSKGSFMMYLARIRTDHQTRQKTLVAVGYIEEGNGVSKVNDSVSGKNNPYASKDSEMDKVTCMLVKEVLECMGRSKDTDNVLQCLAAHLVTNNDDILALTKEYCAEIDMPWGLILALKSKIRSYNIQLGDAWSMQGDANGKMADVTLSLSAPHIAKNKGKIEYVVRRQSSKELSNGMGEPGSPVSTSQQGGAIFDSDSVSEQNGYPRSPKATTPMSHSAFGSSTSHDEMTKLTSMLTDHQKSVNGQVDECRNFVMQSMDKIMDVLEQRVVDINNRQAQGAVGAPLPSSAPAIPATSAMTAKPAM